MRHGSWQHGFRRYGALALSIAAVLAASGQALAQSGAEGDTGMTAATPAADTIPAIEGWEQMVDGLRDLPRQMLARLPDDQQNDPQVRQEIARLALAALGSVTLDTLGGDPDFPSFLPTIGQVLGVGQPNADTIYRAARISPDGVYRLTGTRGSLNQAVIGQVVPRNAETGQGRAHLDLNALPVDGEDRFSVVISATRPDGYTGDWWELRPAANRLLLRMVSYDWASEVSPTLALERIDRPLGRGRVPAEVLEQRLRAMPVAMGFLGPMFVDHAAQIRAEGYVHRFKPLDMTSGGGLDGQFYYETVYDLADDQALIIETEVPDVCPYRSMILTNPIYETTDWYNNHASLNGHQAPVDSDGRWRIVVSARDPGVMNWLDTSGYPSGMIQGRWTHCSSAPIPTITVVPFAEIAAHLPDDVARVTPPERDEILRARRQAMMQRPHW